MVQSADGFKQIAQNVNPLLSDEDSLIANKVCCGTLISKIKQTKTSHFNKESLHSDDEKFVSGFCFVSKMLFFFYFFLNFPLEEVQC